KTIPGIVSRGYLATVLNIAERTAGNLLSPLRALGLIDDDGKPTDRANHWRFDEDYRKVCDAMLQEVYPDELRQAIPSPSSNRDGTVRWFMRNAGVGEAGARKMAATYEIVADSMPGNKPTPALPKAT